MKVIVTGGAGFVGSAVVRHLIADSDWHIINVDKLTYAGNLESLELVAENPRYQFVKLDICNAEGVRALLTREQPDAIMHLAAESHVDRSIDGPATFIQTNVHGTYCLLESALAFWRELSAPSRATFRFHHVSTDEVYGSLGSSGFFHENSPYAPNSPYSASKAAADHLVRAWHRTYGLPVVITNCSNNYGPYQFPEKLIPLMVMRALSGEQLPVYGRGENIRDWLYVEDHAQALLTALRRGRPGEVYHIGGNCERRNIEVVETICDLLDDMVPQSRFRPHRNLIGFVADRPGHDERYAIDCSKIQRELGWKARETFETGLAKTVDWYLQNRRWWERVQSGAYRGERLGLARA